ncbi:MAG: hypothetical protein DMG74_22020, partial [Acidobacteria bacterium]
SASAFARSRQLTQYNLMRSARAGFLALVPELDSEKGILRQLKQAARPGGAISSNRLMRSEG